jgi:hypothetical protein
VTDVDLSGYKVTVERTTMGGWSWEAEAPSGSLLTAPMGHIRKDSAEREALRFIKRHAESPEPVDGETLRARLEA